MSRIETPRAPVVCVAEDRPSCEPGIRLLLSSIAHHSPDLRVELFYPPASEQFAHWAAKFPNVALNRFQLEGAWRGFNIKPRALLKLLQNGLDDLLWVDTDIIISADIRRIYEGSGTDHLIVAEEALCSSHYDGDALRTRSWGLEVGRAVPFQLNSGVVGVTRKHISLLRRWQEVLNSDDYRAAYDKPWDQRPRHFMGDQEVLTALLCSTDFSNIPLKLLYRGSEIIQYFDFNGYTLRERALNLVRKPVFIHCSGHKAWFPRQKIGGVRGALWDMYQDVSPYRLVAREYASDLEDRRWLSPLSQVGRITSALLGNSPTVAGLPFAAAFDIVRHIKWLRTGGEPRRRFGAAR